MDLCVIYGSFGGKTASTDKQMFVKDQSWKMTKTFVCFEPQKRCVSRRGRSETGSDGLRMRNDLSRSAKAKSEETDPKVWRVLLMVTGGLSPKPKFNLRRRDDNNKRPSFKIKKKLLKNKTLLTNAGFC